jgi:hypothetical protein
MGIPAAITRKIHLYSVVPGLESIDNQIGFVHGVFIQNFSNICSDFQSQLSNLSSNSEEVTNFYTGRLSTMYINALEDSIMFSNSATGETLTNLVQRKISLLEAAYSNLTSNNN